jgi:hypothetical protein
MCANEREFGTIGSGEDNIGDESPLSEIKESERDDSSAFVRG